MKLGIVSDLHCNFAGLTRALEIMGQVDELLCEPPRVYRRVKLSKDEPYDTTQTYPVLYG